MLKVNQVYSTIRVFLIMVTIFSGLLILTMIFNVVWLTINNKDVDWSGMSILLGTITAFTTATAWQKVRQKKIEVQSQNNTDHLKPTVINKKYHGHRGKAIT